MNWLKRANRATRNWRKLAVAGKWERIDPFSLAQHERAKLRQLLESELPTRVYGEGLRRFEAPIQPMHAKTAKEYEQALLYRFIKDQSSGTDFQAPIRDAVASAKFVLLLGGIIYEGMADTYVFHSNDTFRAKKLDGKWVQLRRGVALALHRKQHELIINQNHNIIDAWNRKYSWRLSINLRQLLQYDHIEPYTRPWHALWILNKYEVYSGMVEELTRMQPEGPHKKLSRAWDVLTLSEAAVSIGMHAEALRSKTHERDAMRGIDVAQGASAGGKARAREHRSRTHSIFECMRAYVHAGHSVSRAAQLAFRAGFGTSSDANRQLWNRSKRS